MLIFLYLLGKQYISSSLFSISNNGILENWEVVQNKYYIAKVLIGK